MLNYIFTEPENPTHKGMGSHQSAKMLKDEWLTPPYLIEQLGPFDLDPCSPIIRPWDTANTHYSIIDDGLIQPWFGQVWLNPPYGTQSKKWLEKMVQHGNGMVLIFARTETDMFFKYVWDKADSLLFLRGRLYFHHVSGEVARANAGAPSVIVAYGTDCSERLYKSKLPGKFIINK